MTPGRPAAKPQDTTAVDGEHAWLVLPASLPITDGHVHVVRASARAASSSSLASALPADERARAVRFRRPGPRARFLAGRVVMREGLRRCPDGAAADEPLTCSAQGKPRLPSSEAPRFSISHAGDVILVALGRKEVGVDVEAPRPGLDALPLARRMLGPRAVARLAAVEPDARPAVFLELWTRHEAALKCRGSGLAGKADEAAEVSLHSLALPDGYAGAVAATGPFTLSRWTWQP